MWTRLPRWMWISAWLLAFLAGMVNVVGLLGFERIALTHMTGLTSRLAQGVTNGDFTDVALAGSIIVSFVGGAALSGLLIRDSALHWGRRYGVALFLEALLLAAAAVMLKQRLPAGFCVASFACGLQNAIASNFSGSAIRTTHVSGMFTDLGIYIGHWIRRQPIDLLRLRVCISTITGFAMGGLAGGLLYKIMEADTLYVPAAIALAMAGLYQLLLRRYVQHSGRSGDQSTGPRPPPA